MSKPKVPAKVHVPTMWCAVWTMSVPNKHLFGMSIIAFHKRKEAETFLRIARKEHKRPNWGWIQELAILPKTRPISID